MISGNLHCQAESGVACHQLVTALGFEEKEKMSREIKFRAWDYRKDEMIGAAELVASNNEPVQDQLAKIDNLMQFTGLLDSNGIEIYEGDICRVVFFDCHSNDSITIEEGGEFIGAVKEESFMWLLDDGAYICFWELQQTDSEIEVIGNIYQTPDLL